MRFPSVNSFPFFPHPFSTSEMPGTKRNAEHQSLSTCVGVCVYRVGVFVFVHARACALQQCLSTSRIEECVPDMCGNVW